MVIEGTLAASFNPRGFTFIECESAEGIDGDVFLHISKIGDGEDPNLFVRGARVECDVVMVPMAPRRGRRRETQGSCRAQVWSPARPSRGQAFKVV